MQPGSAPRGALSWPSMLPLAAAVHRAKRSQCLPASLCPAPPPSAPPPHLHMHIHTQVHTHTHTHTHTHSSCCSPSVVRNLSVLDEDRLDFELLEQLVAHIDESQAGREGAVLVFLPGGCTAWAVCAVLCCAVLCCAVLCCAVLCCAGWRGMAARRPRWMLLLAPFSPRRLASLPACACLSLTLGLVLLLLLLQAWGRYRSCTAACAPRAALPPAAPGSSRCTQQSPPGRRPPAARPGGCVPLPAWRPLPATLSHAVPRCGSQHAPPAPTPTTPPCLPPHAPPASGLPQRAAAGVPRATARRAQGGSGHQHR